MPRVKKSITINAPVEKVFEYIGNPANIMEWWVNVTAVRDVTGSGEHQTWTFDYKMIGLRFTAKAKVIRSRLNYERRVESEGGMDANWYWEFRPADGGTQLRWVIDYNVPLPVLGKIGELLVVRRMDRIARFSMTNIKERMEA
jgi:carbon monoxide dehydrogenase subunit G